MRIADEIAAQFGNDGSCFTAADGTTLERACLNRYVSAAKARSMWGDGPEGSRYIEVAWGESIFDAVRYEFADGSAIVIAGDAWDIEGAEPFSWEGA